MNNDRADIDERARAAREAELWRRVDAARQFLGAKTVEEQLAEQVRSIHQLRADLGEAREQLARMLTENLRLLQQNDTLQWSLVLAHKTYVQSLKGGA